jgi:hypothetical protein
MPDLEELGGRLDRELPDVRWEGAATLRALGTRRRRGRAAALTAAAAVTVVAVGTWAVAGRPDAAPAPVAPVAPTAPSAPSPALIPPAALLQPEDVGPGHEIQNPHFQLPGPDPGWPFADDRCPRYASLRITAYRTFTAMSGHLVARTGDTEGTTFVHTEVRRYPTGATAHAVMTDIGRIVDACSLFETDGGEFSTENRPATTEHSFADLDEGFAGDESLLVRHQMDTSETGGAAFDRGVIVYAVVRVGDLIAITQFDRDDPQRMRVLGAASAARLRDA